MPILLALGLIVFLLIIVVTGRPDAFEVSRVAAIAAPPEAIFPHVNELRKWEAWSPWAKRDPSATSTYEGPASGSGSSMAWDGNKSVGAGKMTIVESRPNDRIRIRLEFLRPFQATNMAEFQFRPESLQTIVTWRMTGTSNLFFKAFSLFMNCDDMVGKDFAQGLASLKSVVEK